MFSALYGLPDWKKIGWHLGKRIHDILDPPSNDDRPTEEELRSRRLNDVLKGFAYFNTFDELEEWTVSSVDPLQRANIPLFHRGALVGPGKQRSKTILCHDFKGGYLDVDAIRAPSVRESMWSCADLQSVEAFIYFSHRLVSCPPPTWVNCLHQNGVKALGTFIIEPGTPESDRMLTHQNGKFAIAEKLAAMANTLGFDGWLLNVEQGFSRNCTEQIIEFISCLKSALGSSGCVFWYDALNARNEVKYQNGLSELNISFALVADGLFTNYTWDLERLIRSKDLATVHGVDPSKLYFGIDVWAQNNNNSGPPRVTYPQKDGGGTNTGLALRTLANHDVSGAIFAPAWTHEHFSPKLVGKAFNSVAEDVNNSLWRGTPFPRDALCDCKGSPHRIGENQQLSILGSARLFPAGTRHYFSTNFNAACFPTQSDPFSPNAIVPCLGLQSISPAHCGERYNTPFFLGYVYDQDVPGRWPSPRALTFNIGRASQMIEESASTTYRRQELRLYQLAISCVQRQRLTFSYSINFPLPELVEFGLYISFLLDGKTRGTEYIPISPTSSSWSTNDYDITILNQAAIINEVGFWSNTIPLQSGLELLRCHSLRIVPVSIANIQVKCAIIKLQVVESSIGAERHKRLIWEWSSDRSTWPLELPWSPITGPFSHFSIYVNGDAVGISQSVAFPLNLAECEIMAKSGEEGTTFTIKGHCFADLKLFEPAIATLKVVSSPTT